MFEIGEYIIYGVNGVCKVEHIGTVKLSGVAKDRLYYTLRPVSEREGVIYTPVDNKKITMRPILTQREAEELLKDIQEIDSIWVSDDKARDTIYKQAMQKCETREWVRMIKTLYLRKKTRLAEGKKITVSDEKYYRLAQENLYSELSIALGIPKDQMEEYIRKCITKNES